MHHHSVEPESQPDDYLNSTVSSHSDKSISSSSSSSSEEARDRKCKVEKHVKFQIDADSEPRCSIEECQHDADADGGDVETKEKKKQKPFMKRVKRKAIKWAQYLGAGTTEGLYGSAGPGGWAMGMAFGAG